MIIKFLAAHPLYQLTPVYVVKMVPLNTTQLTGAFDKLKTLILAYDKERIVTGTVITKKMNYIVQL